jgi:hypothetical protein
MVEISGACRRQVRRSCIPRSHSLTRSLAHSLTHTHSHYDRNFFTASELTQSDKDRDYCKLLYPELCMLVQAAVAVAVAVAVAQ